MSRAIPEYFNKIHQDAQKRWIQLERDPGLAGPWHQLFQQVQIPRQVISELLQNADDAGATSAVAKIVDNTFIFSHNGDDFNESNFNSLCQFGISDKRHLYTIGFRGMGFKSTFSLGSRVEVYSPTISVAFEKERFTEPIWLDKSPDLKCTMIKIELDSTQKKKKLYEYIEEWLTSAIPLLFFRNIAELKLLDNIITKQVEGSGPIPRSKWINLDAKESHRILHITSEEAAFPKEAIEEIRRERGDPNLKLPGCRVDIIFDSLENHRLYVVLPTEVKPDLPFSCNAPFIQDPARTRIKDPVASPTNQWLLKRIGRLASSSILSWLRNKDLPVRDRADAYEILINPSESGTSLENDCKKIINDEFETNLKKKDILLAESGELTSIENCLAVPHELNEVWNKKQLLRVFGKGERYLLTEDVSSESRELLQSWGWLEYYSNDAVLDRLREKPYPPRPANENLAILWEYIWNQSQSIWLWKYTDLAIVPAKKRKRLYPRDSMVLMGSKQKKLSRLEWGFLGRQVLVVDPGWINFIRKSSECLQKEENINYREDGNERNKLFRAIEELFQSLGLHGGVRIETVLKKASDRIFTSSDPGQKGIRLAHIAARLGVQAPDDFQFLCKDGKWHSREEGLLVDIRSITADLIPPYMIESRILHSDYEKNLSKDEAISWNKWVKSKESGLRSLILPNLIQKKEFSRKKFENFCVKRGGHAPDDYELKANEFWINDYNFDSEVWDYWQDKAKNEPDLWARLVSVIAYDWDKKWLKRSESKASQAGRNLLHNLDHGRLCSEWIAELKDLPCIIDTFSRPRYPSDLFFMTAETAPLQRVESFVHPDIDRVESREPLELLGVRSTPESVDKLIDRLRALAMAPNPPQQEIQNIYDALDRVMPLLPSEQALKASDTFSREKIILDNDGCWQKSSSVFQKNEEGIPGAPILHNRIADLTLWDRIGVPRRPTINYAIEWLMSLDSGQKLDVIDHKRVRVILQWAPRKVWESCNHWLNMNDDWIKVDDIRWMSADQADTDGLFPGIKSETADCTMLKEEMRLISPFDALELITSSLNHKIASIDKSIETSYQPEWIRALAKGLICVDMGEIDHENEEKEVPLESERIHAVRLFNTRLRKVNKLITTPYIDGQPAGDELYPRALWNEDLLYILDDGARHYREIVETIAAQYKHTDLQRAIRDCVGRSETWISDYFKDYYLLDRKNLKLLEGKLAFDKNYHLFNEGEEVDAISSVSTNQDEVPSIVGEIDESESSIFIDEREAEERDVDLGEEANESGNEDYKRIMRKRRAADRSSRQKQLASMFTNEGFSWAPSKNQFIDHLGRIICHNEGLFHWVMLDQAGEERNWYWVGDSSLENGVEIPFEVWKMIKQGAGKYWLVLPDKKGSYRKYDWFFLKPLLNENAIALYPASYRLIKTSMQ
jgi:hypothetical protein